MNISIARTTDLTGYRSVKLDGVTVGRVSRLRRHRYGGEGGWYGYISAADPDMGEFHFETIQDMKAYLADETAKALA